MMDEDSGVARRWRLVANKSSVRRGEPTALAIAEVAVAIAIWGWLVVAGEGWLFIYALAATLSPVFLLHTPASRRRQQQWVRQSLEGGGDAIWFFPAAFSYGAASIMFGMTRHFRAHIERLPENWFTVAFTTDLCFATPVVPKVVRGDGFISIDASPRGGLRLWIDNERAEIQDVIERWRTRRFIPRLHVLTVDLVTLPVLIAFGSVVAVSYFVLVPLILHFCVKGTLPVWLPLLWVASPTVGHGKERHRRTKEYATSPFVVLGLLASALMIAFVVLKIVVYSTYDSALEFWAPWLPSRVVEILVVPNDMPKWQVASSANAVLGIALYIGVVAWLTQSVLRGGRTSAALCSVARVTVVVRRVLSTYTIPVTLFLLWVAVLDLKLPTIPPEWIP